MSDEVQPDTCRGSTAAALEPEPPFKGQDDARLREALRRCSPATRAAAWEYRRTGRLDQIPTIIDGLIEHFVEPDARVKLRSGADGLRLVEDLGIDSLTMLEIVFLAEEVLQVTIENERLRPFRTVGDVKDFVAAKIAGATAAGGAYAPVSNEWPAPSVPHAGL